jgi:hypothetical protein
VPAYLNSTNPQSLLFSLGGLVHGLGGRWEGRFGRAVGMRSEHSFKTLSLESMGPLVDLSNAMNFFFLEGSPDVVDLTRGPQETWTFHAIVPALQLCFITPGLDDPRHKISIRPSQEVRLPDPGFRDLQVPPAISTRAIPQRFSAIRQRNYFAAGTSRDFAAMKAPNTG